MVSDTDWKEGAGDCCVPSKGVTRMLGDKTLEGSGKAFGGASGEASTTIADSLDEPANDVCCAGCCKIKMSHLDCSASCEAMDCIFARHICSTFSLEHAVINSSYEMKL